ncbi:hypothetical protein XENOCAPTIV_027302, partial [Xenoophorus captivus]
RHVRTPGRVRIDASLMFDNNLVASVETPFNVFNGSKFQRLIGSIILRLRGEKAQMKLRRTGGQSKHTSFNPVRIHNEVSLRGIHCESLVGAAGPPADP